MSSREVDILDEFRTAIRLRAVWPRYPLRPRVRAAWWRFADAYARARGAVPVAEINNAIFSEVGSCWVPYA